MFQCKINWRADMTTISNPPRCRDTDFINKHTWPVFLVSGYNANFRSTDFHSSLSLSPFRRLHAIQYRLHHLNTYHAGLGFTEQKSVCFLIFPKFQRLFHELMNQYQACLYLSECIFHGGFKYGHEIPQFRHFLQILLNFWPVVCTRLSHRKH